MGLFDDAVHVAKGAVHVAKDVVDDAGSVAHGALDEAKRFANDPIGTVTAPFGGGDPTGNDGGSSNWAAWGHEEIRSMLDDTVKPEEISEGSLAWNDLQGKAANLVTTSTADLRRTVSNGWRGKSADAAIRSLRPVDEWANTLSAVMQDTSRLMDNSGSAAGYAKSVVPPAKSHNWGESLLSFGTGGGPGALIDAVAQDRAQEEARMEAVRIMTSAYSAPINESSAAVPTYPQLADPTLQPPEHHPGGGPTPGPGVGGVPGGGGVVPGGGGGGGVPGGHVPGGGGPTPTPRTGSYHPPTVTPGQHVPGGPGSPGHPSPTPSQYPGSRSPVGPGGVGPSGTGPGGRFGPDPSAGVPFAPLGGAGSGGDAEAPRRGFRGGGGLGGGRSAGLGGRAGAGSGKGAVFGPRGSAAAGAAESAAEGGRFGTGAAAGGRGGAGAGGVPLAGGGAGRGQGGEDNEHQRPSYLIETDDIFGDGRKVAPPVIGEDPPEYYR